MALPSIGPTAPKESHDMRPSRTSSAAGLRRCISEAVEAALSQDSDRFANASERLAVQDPQRLAMLQAWMIRSLLERLHPDGLSSADAHDVLRHCVQSAAGWFTQPEPTVLAQVLTGALGMSDPDAPAAAGPDVLSQHAALLTADLLSTTGQPLAGYLDAAFAELERAETIELP
jgi:hypothetical protein